MFWIPSLRRCPEFLRFTALFVPPSHEGFRFSGQHVVLLLRALEIQQVETWDCCYSSYNRTSDQNGDTSKIVRGIVDQNAYLRIQKRACACAFQSSLEKPLQWQYGEPFHILAFLLILNIPSSVGFLRPMLDGVPS